MRWRAALTWNDWMCPSNGVQKAPELDKVERAAAPPTQTGLVRSTFPITQSRPGRWLFGGTRLDARSVWRRGFAGAVRNLVEFRQ